MRVVVLSHSHPEIRSGGGEVAAYAQFQALKAAGHTATFVAAVDRDQLGHDGVFGAFRGRADEILWRRPAADPYRVAAIEPDTLKRELDELLGVLKPDLAHFHHYFGFTADALDLTAAAGVPVVLTLHEFGAICAHFGQMVKLDGALCGQWSASECSRCVPDHGPGHVFLRRERLLLMFAAVGRFIAPSRFLADRYAAWGLAPERIAVIENILPVTAHAPRARPPKKGFSAARPLRLAYFGQFTPFKGLDVLVAAMAALPAPVAQAVRLTLYGVANGEANQAYYEALEPSISANAAISLYGPYHNTEMPRLMAAADWMVMPSVWWENSPIVIQEAAAAGLPVLASHIGGMGEKVIDGVTGAHFATGSAQALADRLSQIVSGELSVTPPAVDMTAANAGRLDALMEIYRPLVGG